MKRRKVVEEIVTAVPKRAMDTAGVRVVRKRISKQIADFDRRSVLQVAHELIRRVPFGRFLAYELVEHHTLTMQTINTAEVEALGRGINSWGDVDTFSIYVAGPAWRNGRIPDFVVRRWARSGDRWWRRAALVSTVPLNSAARGGSGDVTRTLAICGLLVRDRDDMVVKAMSWALRALAKRAPKQVQQFISEERQELAPRVIREVSNKLTTGLKNPRKRLTGTKPVD